MKLCTYKTRKQYIAKKQSKRPTFCTFFGFLFRHSFIMNPAKISWGVEFQSFNGIVPLWNSAPGSFAPFKTDPDARKIKQSSGSTRTRPDLPTEALPKKVQIVELLALLLKYCLRWNGLKLLNIHWDQIPLLDLCSRHSTNFLCF